MNNTHGIFSEIINRNYGLSRPAKIYDIAKDSLSLVQRLRLEVKLPVHNGCVNSICWNEGGQYILSGSDDQHLCITDAYTHNVALSIQTGHRANIFSAKFLPKTLDKQIVSCSGDGVVIHTDVERKETSLHNRFECHFGTAYEVATVPSDPHTFLSCGEDGTVRWFDLRIKERCSQEQCKEDVLIQCKFSVTALAINSFIPYHLGVGCSDGTARIFDRRMLGTFATGNPVGPGLHAAVCRFSVPQHESGSGRRITSLCYSPDGQEMLVSYSSDYIYLFDVNDNSRNASKLLHSASDKKGQSGKKGRVRSTAKPLMKRLRVRGDWSDTGPNARPESEMRSPGAGESAPSGSVAHPTGQQPRSLHASLMQRMSDVLTRMFNSPSQPPAGPAPPRRRVLSYSTYSLSSTDSGGSDHAAPQSQGSNLGATPVGGDSTETEPASLVARGTQALDLVDLESGTESEIVRVENEVYQSEARTTSEPPAPATTTMDEDSPSVGNPAEVVIQSFQTLEQEISTRRQDLLERHNMEPLVNLSFNGQGLNSGLITMGVSETSEGPQPASSSSGQDDSQPEEMDTTVAAAAASGEDFLVEMDDKWETTDDDDEDSSSLTWRGSEGSSQDLLGPPFKPGHVNCPKIKQTYTGHRNARTMIKEATFWGNGFVLSGSDCGHIFVWDRHTSQLVNLFEADHHVVNCLQPHPFDPILASSGIDYDIKLWVPLRDEPFFDQEKASEIIQRNKIMLEETKDTITVPASFMIRMLASLNHMRNTGRSSLRQARGSSQDQPSSDD